MTGWQAERRATERYFEDKMKDFCSFLLSSRNWQGRVRVTENRPFYSSLIALLFLLWLPTLQFEEWKKLETPTDSLCRLVQVNGANLHLSRKTLPMCSSRILSQNRWSPKSSTCILYSCQVLEAWHSYGLFQNGTSTWSLKYAVFVAPAQSEVWQLVSPYNPISATCIDLLLPRSHLERPSERSVLKWH